jgi:serine protease
MSSLVHHAALWRAPSCFLRQARSMRTWLSLGLATLAAVQAQAAAAAPWHLGAELQTLAAPAAINSLGLAPGPHRVVVAVLDSGVLSEHPSLAGRLLPGYDMMSAPANVRGGRSANSAPDPLDSRCAQRANSRSIRTHGTEVASLIAGNGAGDVLGVHPQALLLPVRVIGACGMFRRDLLDALRWAAGLPVEGVADNPHPARVINLSLAGGSPTCSPDLQALVHQLRARGVFLVAAAGNNFQKPLQEPANCQGVISVGALDAENRIEVYSALDPRTQVYAPGGGKKLDTPLPWGVNKLRVATYDLDLFGRERANVLDRGVGTSYAAPLVSGFIALWLSHQPDRKPENMADHLPRFLRPVEPLAKCADCQPRGLAANPGLAAP